jgi:hypothetical protein
MIAYNLAVWVWVGVSNHHEIPSAGHLPALPCHQPKLPRLILVDLTTPTPTPATICHLLLYRDLSWQLLILSLDRLNYKASSHTQSRFQACTRTLRSPGTRLGIPWIRTAALTCRHTRNTTSRSVEMSLRVSVALVNASSFEMVMLLPTPHISTYQVSAGEASDSVRPS